MNTEHRNVHGKDKMEKIKMESKESSQKQSVRSKDNFLFFILSSLFFQKRNTKIKPRENHFSNC